MTAGDSSLQTEILLDVHRDVLRRIEIDAKDWWLLKDVAELYAKYYGEARRKRSERAFLSPLGLTHETFIQRQPAMAESIVRMIPTELINFKMPPVATIFAGTDPSGTHIYVASDDDIECVDKVGFAAIGIGRWHANSQFMFAQHDRFKPLPETLLLTYAAKKRGEVSPGVGEGTDMFAVGPGLGTYSKILPSIVADLEKMYLRTREAGKKAIEESNLEVTKYVESLVTPATTPDQEVKPKDSGGNPSSDESKLEDAPEEDGRRNNAAASSEGAEAGVQIDSPR